MGDPYGLAFPFAGMAIGWKFEKVAIGAADALATNANVAAAAAETAALQSRLPDIA
jgi:hypothetical protein